MAPLSVIDYIVLHELCHLVHHDHTQNYWKLVQHIMPEYTEKKEWLRINGPALEL